MNIEYKGFIGVYQDVYPDGYCQHIINEFERFRVSGAGKNRQESENFPKHKKDDILMFLNIKTNTMLDFNNNNSKDMFFKGLQDCYDLYTEQFSVLKDARINGNTIKVQRTDSGCGYHVWHAEQGNNNTERVLVYMLYLNTLSENDGGETEFLYQKLRLKPKENTMVIWPAAFTHAHRGNVVLGNQSKYIVTGWFNYD
jgi:hypothetical protein